MALSSKQLDVTDKKHIVVHTHEEEVHEPEFTSLLYFFDDLKYREKKDQALRACQYYDHEVAFSLWFFVEAFVLHIL